MVSRTLWLWLCVGWLTETVVNPSPTSICDLGPCRCTRGQLTCDCYGSPIKEILLKEDMMDSYSFSSISMANCAHVHMTSGVLSGLPALQQVSVSNVPRLTLEEKSFSWTTQNPQHSGLLVNITNCAIPEIPSYCFRGSLRDVLFHYVNVSHVRAFAFTAIDHADKIEFSRVDFGHFAQQSFKKFKVGYLRFSGGRVAVFPTRTMLDVEVHQEMRFDHITVGKIETAAFKIHESRTFRLVQSTIGRVEHKAFHLHTKGDVSIDDNVFGTLERGAIVGFTVEARYLEEAGKQEFVFDNNTLVNFESAALTFNTTGFNPRLDWIVIDRGCSCAEAELWASDLVFFSSDAASTTAAPQVNSVMYCMNPKPTNLKDFQRLYCNVTKSSLLVIVLVIAALVIVVGVIGLVLYCGVRKKGKRYINVRKSKAPLRPADGTKASHMLVVPEGKTYRETELHVIVEHAEPIVPTDYIKDRFDRDQ